MTCTNRDRIQALGLKVKKNHGSGATLIHSLVSGEWPLATGQEPAPEITFGLAPLAPVTWCCCAIVAAPGFWSS